ncbi:thiolase family protein [Symbiobacterium terraclitae]|uniref:thiolase family protein n=1 Tax=Symbiobacterium terraclitae TaxID=557451 RepID=UPI0035B56ED0
MEAVIVTGVRTPFSKFGGALREMHSIDLGALVIAEAVRRAGLQPAEVDEVYYGATMPAELALQQNIPARQALLQAGLPPTTVSLTVDRACCSSTTAVQLAQQAILAGRARVVLAMGAENMSNVPLLLLGSRWGHRPGGLKLFDPIYEAGYPRYSKVSCDAGEVALEHGITREMQDEWAVRSHHRYAAALEAGRFAEEIMPVPVPRPRGAVELFERDELPRPSTTLEALAKLPTVYGSPTVTAGNAPGLDAGAAAVVVMAEEEARRRSLRPLARIRCAVSVAIDHRRLAEAPAYAIRKALDVTGLSLEQLERIEINEAFAAVPLVSTKLLAEGDPALWERLKERTNVNGGAVAIGHPVGASGARLVLTLALELRRSGCRFGVAAICGGLGQADAIVLESLAGE